MPNNPNDEVAHVRPHRRRPCACHRVVAACGGQGLPQEPEAAADPDDRDRRGDRHRPVPRRRRPAQRGRPVAGHRVRGLRVLRVPDPAGPGRTGPAPPSSGSFVSYAREFFGEKAAFVSGWFYWINWATTTIVDITAAALYMNFFGNYIPWMARRPAVGLGPDRPGRGPRPEPRLGQGLRRNGILVRPDQGRRPRRRSCSSAPTSSSSAPPWTASTWA